MSLCRPGQAEMFAQFLLGLIAWSDVGALAKTSKQQQGDHPGLVPDLLQLSHISYLMSKVSYLIS